MASILIYSIQADGAPVAFRLAHENHFVKMTIKEERYRRTFRGFRNPSLVTDPTKSLDQFDLILFDMVGRGKEADQLREKGRLVLGGGTLNDKLELDRAYGLKVARSLTKLSVPNTVEVSSASEAIKELSELGKPGVIKPLGNKPTMFTLVSDDPKNRALIGALRAMPDLAPCLIQEVIDGIEVSTEGWFNGKNWCKPFNHTIEKKRFMEGDKGPNTGCMGNVVWLAEDDKLIASALTPLEPLLQRTGYVGPLDVNCIVTPDEAFFLEFTARFGYDAIQALAEHLKTGLFEFLYAVATRGHTNKLFIPNQISIAVRLSMPPWPHSAYHAGIDELSGLQVLDSLDEAKRHVWLADVAQAGEKHVLAGVDGMIGCFTARGESLREAKRRVYRTVGNLVIHKDVQYRYDIGKDEETDVAQLVSWGWVKGEKNELDKTRSGGDSEGSVSKGT